jgi:tetratricopeptide (TPR) repeat protein
MGRFSRLETTASETSPSASGAAPSGELVVGGTSGVGQEASTVVELDAGGALARGERALFMEERQSAQRWFSRAIDLDSRLLDAWTRLIQLMLLRGYLGEAAAWIKRALDVFPDAPALLGLRAVQFARQGQLREAMAGADLAIERGGADPWVMIARGQVLLIAESGNAVYCLDQAIQMARPDDWQTPVWIALILRERRMWAKAIDCLARAAERSESQPAIWYQVGLCRAALGHSAQATKAYRMAMQFCMPDDPLYAKINKAGIGSSWMRVFWPFDRVLRWLIRGN